MIQNPALGNTLQEANGVGFLGSALTTAIAVLFVVAAIIFFFLLVTGAIAWMTSGGDKAKYETAKSRITQAFVGLLILFLVFAIVNIVGCIFGISLLEFEIGELNVSFSGSPVCGGGGNPTIPPGTGDPPIGVF